MANNNRDRMITVQSSGFEYPVMLGYDSLTQGKWSALLPATTQIMLVSNQTIAQLYLQVVLDKLPQEKPRVYLIPDGEDYKNQHSANAIIEGMLNAGFGRDCLLIALGGGVITDLTGFVASI